MLDLNHKPTKRELELRYRHLEDPTLPVVLFDGDLALPKETGYIVPSFLFSILQEEMLEEGHKFTDDDIPFRFWSYGSPIRPYAYVIYVKNTVLDTIPKSRANVFYQIDTWNKGLIIK